MYGQVVIGPPGSGKTTYCHAMHQLLNELGRPCALINIDPANESVPYTADVNIADLIQLEDVMEAHRLGPNGGLVYCMEYLEKNLDWLLTKISSDLAGKYLIIDFPGQVELYTHNNAVKNIVARLEKEGEVRLAAVHLVDSHYCADPSKFLSVCLTSLTTMLQVELPHVNVLSKADLVEKYGKLDFNIDFYTEVMDLEYLLDRISDDPFTAKFKKLNEAMSELVTNYSLVHFVPCSVKSKEAMLAMRNAVDKANGYCFSSVEESRLQAQMAFSNNDFEYAKTKTVREQYMMPSDEEEGEEPPTNKPKLGNDLDQIDIQPGFQV